MDDIGKVRPERPNDTQYQRLKRSAAELTPGLLILCVSAGVLIAGMLLWTLNEGYKQYRIQIALSEMAEVLKRPADERTIRTSREGAESQIRSISNFIFSPLCEPGSTFENTAQCYMTPSGKRVQELEGEERQRWMQIATSEIKERERIERLLKTEEGTVQLSREQLARAEAEERATQCAFWKQELGRKDTQGNRQMVSEWCQ